MERANVVKPINTQQNKQDAVKRKAVSGGSNPVQYIYSLQNTIGNRATTRLLQAKLSVSQPGDEQEREADRMAEKVMRMPAQGIENQPAKSEGSGGNTSGRPLDRSVREFMEPRFGHDFSDVRVHDSKEASESAKAVNAKAYTIGNNIVFNTAEYSPETSEGRKLVAHELGHVVKQNHGSIGTTDIVRRTEGKDESTPKEEDPYKNESLGFLDSEAVEFAIAQLPYQNKYTWPLIREILRGFKGSMNDKKNKDMEKKAIERFTYLPFHPKDFLDFNVGYTIGFAKGFVSPITDLYSLVKMVLQLSQRAITWLIEQKDLLKNDEELWKRVLQLYNACGDIKKKLEEAVDKFLSNPLESIMKIDKLIDEIMAKAIGKARSIGATISESILEFLNLPWKEFGDKLGYVVGMAVVQILMVVFSEGIANAISAAGRMVASSAKWASAEAVNCFKWLVTMGAKLVNVLKSSLKVLVEELLGSELVQELIQLFEKLIKSFKEFSELFGPKLAVEGAGGVPGGVISKGSKAEQLATRTNPTTVSDLKPKPLQSTMENEAAGTLEAATEETVSTGGNVVNYAKYKEVLRTTESANPLVDSLRQTGNLPSNYITKAQAEALGWKPGKALGNYAPGKQIGGDVFENTTGVLPSAPGRVWYEADVGLTNTMTRAKQPGTRLLYSNDGQMYVTYDHYQTVNSIGTWK